jgi:hypothetical protein
LIEVGGNGTLNEVINGVMRSKVFTGGVKWKITCFHFSETNHKWFLPNDQYARIITRSKKIYCR